MEHFHRESSSVFSVTSVLKSKKRNTESTEYHRGPRRKSKGLFVGWQWTAQFAPFGFTLALNERSFRTSVAGSQSKIYSCLFAFAGPAVDCRFLRARLPKSPFR